MILGKKLRELRQSQKRTMQQVADQSGLSVGFISQVERGLTVPSLASLSKLAAAVDQPVDIFLDPAVKSAELTRATDRIPFTLGRNDITFERLSHQFDGSKLTALLIHEPPGHRTEPVSHQGEEIFFMLKGELTVELEGKQIVLRSGDSYHFASSRMHSTWNHRTETATLLWCGTLDVFGQVDKPSPHRLSRRSSEKDALVSPLSHF